MKYRTSKSSNEKLPDPVTVKPPKGKKANERKLLEYIKKSGPVTVPAGIRTNKKI